MTAYPIFRTSNPVGRGSMPILPMDAEQARFWQLRRERASERERRS